MEVLADRMKKRLVSRRFSVRLNFLLSFWAADLFFDWNLPASEAPRFPIYNTVRFAVLADLAMGTKRPLKTQTLKAKNWLKNDANNEAQRTTEKIEICTAYDQTYIYIYNVVYIYILNIFLL